MIEKYKALEAENKRLKDLNVELTAKCNWYNSDGARLERERDELKRQLAEHKAENERLNTVPMKYRRMAFNAQLQKENEDLQFRNDRLVQDFADVTEANDALRRIHAENIEIFTRQLAEYKADAAKWRAYQKRKQEVIAAGMGRKILRDLETHDALPAFYKEMKKGATE